MTRRFVDEALRTWQVYAAPGPFSAPRPSRIVFHCTSEFVVGSRELERDMDRSDTERAIREASDADLRSWLGDARRVPESGSRSRVPQPMT